MVSRDWAEQRIHECIVASPCRFCPDLNLGLRAISLSGAMIERSLPVGSAVLIIGALLNDQSYAEITA
jgi:hypothetical protein